MNVIGGLPSAPLRDFVYWYAYYDSFTSDDTGFRMIPEGTVDVLIPLDGTAVVTAGGTGVQGVNVSQPAVVGPAQTYTVYDTIACSRVFGIVFKPGGAARFLVPDVDVLATSILSAYDDFGPALRVLRERLLEEPDPHRMFPIADAFLKRRFEPELRHADEIGFAVSAIRRGDTLGVSLVDFAESKVGFSHKHFVDLFKRRVGMTPKRYERIVRFSLALDYVRRPGNSSWKHIASALGYVDVSHLTREFHLLAGMTPGEYLKMTWTHRQVLSEPDDPPRDN